MVIAVCISTKLTIERNIQIWKVLCKIRDAWDEAICDNSKVLEALAMKLKDSEATWQTGVEESNENLKCKKCEKMFNNERGF